MTSAAEHRSRNAELTVDQIRDHTYPLLAPTGVDGPAYARRSGEEFVELLAVQDGDAVRRLTGDEVAKAGAAELFSLAEQRLRFLPTSGCQTIRRDGGEFHVLRGPSDFIASKLLLLPDVIQPVIGAAANGVLVSVPSRRELAFASIGGELPATLVHLARYTVMTYQDGPHPLSPITFWWHRGVLTPVVTMDSAGDVEFRLPPVFIDAASGLAR